MPLAFSFQSQRRHFADEPPSFSGAVDEAAASPDKENQNASTPQKALPLFDSPPSTGGLAAMAVNQSWGMPQPPESIPHAVMPRTAIAASLASAAKTPGELLPDPGADKTAVPAVDSWKTEIDEGINQLRNDIFAAVMGVSALKDRLDGLEYHAPAPSQPANDLPEAAREQILAWIEDRLASCLDEKIACALDQVISARQESLITRMSTAEFFRQPPGFPLPDRRTAFAQAPTILATSLS